MKTLILIRHAEAGWDDFGQADVERSLTAHGQRQAKAMGQQMCAVGLKPGMIVSSTAKRAKMTTELLCAQGETNIEAVIWRNNLYLAEAHVLFETVRECDDDVETLALVAHNPGILELADELLIEPALAMAPCTVIAISWPVQSWQSIKSKRGMLNKRLEAISV